MLDSLGHLLSDTHTFPIITRPQNPIAHLILLVNPISGSKNGLSIMEYLIPIFEVASVGLTVLPTLFRGHARKIISEIDFNGIHGVVAIGGDGTFCEMVNGMVQDRSDGKKVPLGLIPAGSTNNIVHHIFSGETSPAQVATWVTRLTPVQMDLPKVSYLTEDGKIDHYYCPGQLSWGLAASAATRAENWRWTGSLSHQIGFFLEVLDPSPTSTVTVAIDGIKIEGHVKFLLVCNVGGGMKSLSQAKIDDDFVDVLVILENVGEGIDILEIVRKISNQAQLPPGVQYYKAKVVELGGDTKFCIRVDGEIHLVMAPVKVEMVDKKIDVFGKAITFVDLQ